MNACRASCASFELDRISDAFEVNTMVVSRELSTAARMIRLLVHCTSGGIARIALEAFCSCYSQGIVGVLSAGNTLLCF